MNKFLFILSKMDDINMLDLLNTNKLTFVGIGILFLLIINFVDKILSIIEKL